MLRVRSVFFSALALAASLSAQQYPFFQIATTDDARQIYVWSRLPLKTEPPQVNFASGLYQLFEGSIARVFSETYDLLPNLAQDRLNFHISGGGQTVIWTDTIHCVGGSACIGRPPTSQSRILRAGIQEPQTLGGMAQISHSGRYLLQFGNGPATLRDLETGATSNVTARPLASGRALTSEGRVLGLAPSDDRRLVLWSASQIDTLVEFPSTPTEATVSDDGRVVVYRTPDGTLTRIEGSARNVLGVGSEVALSNDGGLAVFRREDECFLARRSQVESLKTQAVACTVSGFGTAVLVLTQSGQVLQFTPTNQSVTELVPPTPYGFVGGGLAPGAVLTWQGQGQIRLLLNGTPLPQIRDIPGDLWFQVPFDVPVDGSTQRLEIETSSPFGRAPVQVPMVSRHPYFFGDKGLTVAHEDFRGLVTAQDPAQPGEILHLWAVGLGAVSPKVKAGDPGPSNPPATLVDPFDCRPLRGEGDIPVIFAGLAPGMKGIYQVDVKLPPAPLPNDGLFLNCGTTGNEAQRHGGWIPTKPALDELAARRLWH
jgi:uncharacterized protein (TIGR03437 family)